MGVWIACAEGFIAADVIRWREGIWERRGPKGGRAMKIGDRDVIAEVLSGPDADGWVMLLVRDCKVQVGPDGYAPKSGDLKVGSEMKRKASTVLRGKVERMRWSDEAARLGVVGSKFMRRNPVPPASKDDARGS